MPAAWGVDRRRVVQLAPPLPAPGRRRSPWGGVMPGRGEEHLQRDLLVAPVLSQPALSAATSAPRSTANRCAVNIHDVNGLKAQNWATRETDTPG